MRKYSKWMGAVVCVCLLATGCGATGSRNPDISSGAGETSTQTESGENNATVETQDGEKQTESDRGERVVTYYQNRIVGMDADGEIKILAELNNLNEESGEYICGVTSYGDDILYVIGGYVSESDSPYSYRQIYSLRMNAPVTERVKNSTIVLTATDEGVIYSYLEYGTDGKEIYHYNLLEQSADWSYSEKPVYEDFIELMRSKGYRPVDYSSIAADLSLEGVTCVYDAYKRIQVIDKTGEILRIFEPEHEIQYINAKTANGIVYGNYDTPDGSYEAGATRTYFLNLENGKEQEIRVCDDPDESFCLLHTNDRNRIFYSIVDESEYGHVRTKVFCMDPVTMESVFLYDSEEIPGMKNYYGGNGTGGFAAAGEYCLFLRPTEHSVNWHYCRIDDPKSVQDLGITEYESVALQYGDVSYVSKTVQADSTEEVIYQYYLECLQLTGTDDGIAAINEQLRSNFDQSVDYAEKQVTGNLESFETDEEWFAAGSYESYVDTVREIGSRYLAIDFGGYEYWGGAHGYPYREYLIFDRQTGAEMTFSDLYTGSEETFKDLVATYTVQDWLSTQENHSGYSPYYGWGDEESAYNELYANARLDMLIRFDLDGLVICYTPYEYGPYASGFIEVTIPYEALGMENILS